jgi:hypothetical protein
MMIRRYLHQLSNGRFVMLPWPPLPLTSAYAPAQATACCNPALTAALPRARQVV